MNSVLQELKKGQLLMKRKILMIRSLIFTAAFACAGAASALELDTAVRHGVLPNGLTYYIRQNNYPEHQAEFFIAQKVGSMQEEEEQRGLAHFLEHMCFNGTKHFPGNSIVKYLERIGVKFGENLNAYTAFDETVYNISGVPTSNASALDSCLLILHDWSNALLLETKDIDEERSVIHEEWRMGSSAFRRMYERALPQMMPDNRYGKRLPIGLMRVVDHFDPKVLRDYYHRWYRPDLQGIIVVGDIDVDVMEKKIKDLFGPVALPQHTEPRVYVPVADNPQPIVVSEQDPEQTLTVVQMMFKHNPWPDNKKSSEAYMQNKVLQAMSLAVINERLSDLSTKADVPFAAAYCEDEGFLVAKTKEAFTVNIVPKEGELDKAVKQVMSEVFRADKYGFNASELERAKAKYLSALESIYQNKDKRKNETFAQEYVQHFLNGEPAPGIEREYQLFSRLYSEVSLQQVNDFYSSRVHDTDSNLVIYSVSPEKEGLKKPEPQHLLQLLSQARATDLGAYQDAVSQRPLIASLPTAGKVVKERKERFGFTEWQLSNGVKVWFRDTDFKANEVLMHAFSPGGSGYYSGTDMIQLQFFDDIIAASGLGGFKATELPKILAGKQVSLSPSLSSRSEGFDGSANPKDLRTLFELIYLSFREPSRDEESVASTLNQIREVLRNQQARPTSDFSDSVSVALYGHHPRLLFVRPETVDKVNYDRVLEIYQERFCDASDFTFVFCGNLDVDSLRLFSEQYLATLPALYKKEKPVDTKLYKLKGERVLSYCKPMQTAQCQSITAWFGPLKHTLKNEMLMEILGQILDIRYVETIREKMGAAYALGVSGKLTRNTADKSEYLMQTFAPLKPELADSAMMVMDAELKHIAEQGIEEGYINKVKEYMLKEFRDAEKKNATWMQALCTFKQYGVDEVSDYETVLKSISSDDLRKIASRIWKDRNKATVLLLPQK